jgi:hypothetical protein
MFPLLIVDQQMKKPQMTRLFAWKIYEDPEMK